MSPSYLKGIVSLVAPIQIALSIYFLLRGHNQPGGGFIGGLVGASAIVLFIFFAMPAINKVKMVTEAFIGTGLVLVFLSGLPGLLTTKGFLFGFWGPAINLPLIANVKLGTVLLFDIGVYLIVIGFSGYFTAFCKEEHK